jgi:chromatin segregation and condensation protein Rec8/ScpA/Scc1 (kleisin family)
MRGTFFRSTVHNIDDKYVISISKLFYMKSSLLIPRREKEEANVRESDKISCSDCK